MYGVLVCCLDSVVIQLFVPFMWIFHLALLRKLLIHILQVSFADTQKMSDLLHCFIFPSTNYLCNSIISQDGDKTLCIGFSNIFFTIYVLRFFLRATKLKNTTKPYTLYAKCSTCIVFKYFESFLGRWQFYSCYLNLLELYEEQLCTDKCLTTILPYTSTTWNFLYPNIFSQC